LHIIADYYIIKPKIEYYALRATYLNPRAWSVAGRYKNLEGITGNGDTSHVWKGECDGTSIIKRLLSRGAFFIRKG
jgi:hypothetical protein